MKKKTPQRAPIAQQLKQGARRLASFTGDDREPRARRMQLAPLPCVAVGVGLVVAIEYRALQKGTMQVLRHKFNARSAPTLAVTSDGKKLMLLAGDYQFTRRGLVDKRK